MENSPDANDAEPWLKDPCIEVEPVTPKLPVILALPVYGNAAPPPADVRAKDAVKAWVAYEAVPINAPVSEPVKNEAVREFKTASDPDTMTFFQFGIVLL